MIAREEKQYKLNCDKCGGVFESSEAFPSPHICHKCSKREEVKEGIQKWSEDWCPNCPDGVEELFSYLHSQGVVIKIKGKLPKEDVPCDECIATIPIKEK